MQRSKSGLTIGFLLCCSLAWAQPVGGIRGVVYDKDFDVTLPEAKITIAETGQSVQSGGQGNYVIPQVKPGTYTLVFSKPGFVRQVQSNVVVSAGQLTEVDVWLSGEFTEMEEFVVQELRLAAGTEAALLDLRMKSPSLMDSISADLMSQAGAGDAASALRLVAGASIQDGRFAVIRGLPDRYVSSQMNGVRLPSADEDTRAAELDQFPSDVIESVQVSKTFTPDQQGDASGGAVNVVLKGIPEENFINLGVETGFNSQVVGQDEFLSYDGGGVDLFGKNEDLEIPSGGNFTGPVGIMQEEAPINLELDFTAGGRSELKNGYTLGGLLNFFYERDSSHFENGIDDEKWVTTPGGPMVPQYIQGTPQQGDFKTQLFDITQSSQSLQWGGLAALGIENEKHSLTLHNLFTFTAEDTATLAEDTRGKEFFFPGHDPNDPSTPGHDNPFAAPFLRTETLEYTERITNSLQLQGTHELPFSGFEIEPLGLENFLNFLAPELDWTYAYSLATSEEPDKRQFGSFWTPERQIRFGDEVFTIPPTHRPFKPAENFTLGNLQRTWEEISEDSNQFQVNLTFPFKQWTNDEGYIKIGTFYDKVTRTFEQETFSNFNNNNLTFEGDFDESFSGAFPNLPTAGAITDGPPFVDVDFDGEQQLIAGFGMVDLPLTSSFKLIGGVRFESVETSIINFPERDVTWIPPGSSGPVKLNPGDADVDFKQDDLLPSIGFTYTPFNNWTLRGSYSRTVARQTFKELSPIQQQEFLGGDVFIGNPFLEMSSLQNFDLRLDYTPFPSSLVSLTYFHKDIKDPIEFVQRFAGFTFTTPRNFPEGTMDGVEFEVRQQLDRFWDPLDGLAIGGNVTYIDSEVTLPPDEAAQFNLPNIQAPMTTREMTNAPEYLLNLFLTYEFDHLGWPGARAALFYTVTGDTLVTGAGQSSGNFVPSVFETTHGRLNFTLSQAINDNWSWKFEAENLTNPKIETVYRSDFIDGDVVKTSHREGREFTFSLNYKF